MSYCVNCGVELDKSAKKCALCSAPVTNPMEPGQAASSTAPYPDKVVLPPGVRRRYAAFIVSMVVLIPNIVCAVINILFPATGVWAVYVVASSALAWVLFVQPFIWHKTHPYSIIAIDAIATGAYLYVFYAVGSEKGWFYEIAMPMLLLLEAMLLLSAYWLRMKKRDWPDIVIAVLLETALYSFCVDFLIHLFIEDRLAITFSIVIIACCAALIGFFIAVKSNRYLRAWLSRKFFI